MLWHRSAKLRDRPADDDTSFIVHGIRRFFTLCKTSKA
jgi:hypothetical protein